MEKRKEEMLLTGCLLEGIINYECEHEKDQHIFETLERITIRVDLDTKMSPMSILNIFHYHFFIFNLIYKKFFVFISVNFLQCQ